MRRFLSLLLGLALLVPISTNAAGPGPVPPAQLPNNTTCSNVSGSQRTCYGVPLSQLLDAILGNTRGYMIFRGATGWSVLPPPPSAGTYSLQIIGGGGTDPFWASTGSSVFADPTNSNLLVDPTNASILTF